MGGPRARTRLHPLPPRLAGFPFLRRHRPALPPPLRGRVGVGGGAAGTTSAPAPAAAVLPRCRPPHRVIPATAGTAVTPFGAQTEVPAGTGMTARGRGFEGPSAVMDADQLAADLVHLDVHFMDSGGTDRRSLPLAGEGWGGGWCGRRRFRARSGRCRPAPVPPSPPGHSRDSGNLRYPFWGANRGPRRRGDDSAGTRI